MDALEEMLIRVAVPTRQHTVEEFLPGGVIFVRIQFVGLRDVKLAVAFGLFDEGRLSGGEAGGDRS